MPDSLRVLIPSRRLRTVAVAFLCAAVASASSGDKPRRERSRAKPAIKSATQPTEPAIEPTPGSLLAERRRLNRIPRTERSVEEIAALAGIDFLIAVGNADGSRVAGLIDVVGYQQLPEGDLLWDDPPRPIDPNTLAGRISARGRIAVGELPVETVEVRPRTNLGEFPAIALWMTAEDRALVVRAPDQAPSGWVTKDACLVIRVRADKATITGGTFFDVLPAVVPAALEPAPAAQPPPPVTQPARPPLPADRMSQAPTVTPPVVPKPVAPIQPVRTPAATRPATPTTRPQPSTPPPPPPDDGPPEEDK